MLLLLKCCFSSLFLTMYEHFFLHSAIWCDVCNVYVLIAICDYYYCTEHTLTRTHTIYIILLLLKYLLAKHKISIHHTKLKWIWNEDVITILYSLTRCTLHQKPRRDIHSSEWVGLSTVWYVYQRIMVFFRLIWCGGEHSHFAFSRSRHSTIWIEDYLISTQSTWERCESICYKLFYFAVVSDKFLIIVIW